MKKKPATKKVATKKAKKKQPKSIIFYALDYDKEIYDKGVVDDGSYCQVFVNRRQSFSKFVWVRAELVNGLPFDIDQRNDALSKAKPRKFETVLNTIPYPQK